MRMEGPVLLMIALVSASGSTYVLLYGRKLMTLNQKLTGYREPWPRAAQAILVFVGYAIAVLALTRFFFQ